MTFTASVTDYAVCIWL